MADREIRIFVADDEYHICEGLKESLSKVGYAVDVAYVVVVGT